MRTLPLRGRGALALFAALVALVAAALAPAWGAAETGGAGQVEGGGNLSNTAFDRQGMWVWYVSHSEGGSVPAIVARAKRNDVGTVYVKSGDGGTYWSQFNRGLVGALHNAGLSVCAWQFVYGDTPVAEAKVAAAAVKRGADCFVIDAEADYEGKYAAADTYVRALRSRVGDTFPISLAAFPYVDYHPSFPYSVFLGPGGATYNQPQMYWKTIGTSVRAVYEHTYLYNRVYGHPIYPIGQTYEAPGSAGIKLFRRFAASYGGLPPSWWSWQETNGREWGAVGADSATAAGRRLPPGSRPPAAEAQSPRRPRRLGPGAPDRRRRRTAGDRHLRPADRPRRARLQGSPRPPRQRDRRHRNLERPPHLHPLPAALDRRRRERSSERTRPSSSPTALGRSTGEGLRDPAGL